MQIADDQAKRQYGLMYRTSLAPDAGMLFVFNPPADPARVGFWMKDTLLPLSIAFISPQLRVLDLQEMAPQTLAVHRPLAPYSCALEANQGYFKGKGVAIGDAVSVTPA